MSWRGQLGFFYCNRIEHVDSLGYWCTSGMNVVCQKERKDVDKSAQDAEVTTKDVKPEQRSDHRSQASSTREWPQMSSLTQTCQEWPWEFKPRPDARSECRTDDQPEPRPERSLAIHPQPSSISIRSCQQQWSEEGVCHRQWPLGVIYYVNVCFPYFVS